MLSNSQAMMKQFAEGKAPKSGPPIDVVRFCYIHLHLYAIIVKEARQVQQEQDSVPSKPNERPTKPRKPVWDNLWMATALALEKQWAITRNDVPVNEEYWHRGAGSKPLSKDAYENEVATVAKGCLLLIFQMDDHVHEQSSYLFPDAFIERIRLFMLPQTRFKTHPAPERYAKLIERLRIADTSLPQVEVDGGIEEGVFDNENEMTPPSSAIDLRPPVIKTELGEPHGNSAQQGSLQRTNSQLGSFSHIEISPMTPGVGILRDESDSIGTEGDSLA